VPSSYGPILLCEFVLFIDFGLQFWASIYTDIVLSTKRSFIPAILCIYIYIYIYIYMATLSTNRDLDNKIFERPFFRSGSYSKCAAIMWLKMYAIEHCVISLLDVGLYCRPSPRHVDEEYDTRDRLDTYVCKHKNKNCYIWPLTRWWLGSSVCHDPHNML